TFFKKLNWLQNSVNRATLNRKGKNCRLGKLLMSGYYHFFKKDANSVFDNMIYTFIRLAKISGVYRILIKKALCPSYSTVLFWGFRWLFWSDLSFFPLFTLLWKKVCGQVCWWEQVSGSAIYFS